MSDSEDKVLSDGHVQHPPEAGEPASHETVLPAAGGLSQDKVRNILIFTISLQKFWSTPHFIARGVKDLISSIRFAPFNVVTITNVWVVWSLRKAQATKTGEGGVGGIYSTGWILHYSGLHWCSCPAVGFITPRNFSSHCKIWVQWSCIAVGCFLAGLFP